MVVVMNADGRPASRWARTWEPACRPHCGRRYRAERQAIAVRYLRGPDSDAASDAARAEAAHDANASATRGHAAADLRARIRDAMTRVLGIGGSGVRVAATVAAALATFPVGLAISAVAQLAVVVAILAIAVATGGDQ
jgi:hypothetical protein